MAPHIDEYSFTRYLAAKRAVDDAALNRHVYSALVERLKPLGALSVLEVGCGTGTMLQRLSEWGFFAGHAGSSWLGIDNEAQNITVAQALAPLPGVTARWRVADLFDFAAASAAHYDLIVANAVLDLLELDKALPALHGLLVPGGLLWLTINFDGLTLLDPVLDPALDALIERRYHATMDERRLPGDSEGGHSGDSRTGRRLFSALPRHSLTILAAGSSDWVVHPGGSGGYPGDTAYFLHHMLHFFEISLAGDPALDPNLLAQWLTMRHMQIERAELVFITHQLDFLAQGQTLSTHKESS